MLLKSALVWVITSSVKKSDFLTLEDGTDTLSRSVGKGLPDYHTALRNTPEERRS
jgi:hypothetical protein